MTLRVIDRFTTQDGEWFVSDKPYSISQAAIDKYRGWQNELGGASHIYVKVQPGDSVRFFTTDPTTPQTPPAVIAGVSGWVNFGMWHTSAYWPPNEGPWHVEVNGVEVAKGLGLPEGYHVSTFLIVSDAATTPTEPLPPQRPAWREKLIQARALIAEVLEESPQ